VRVPLWGSIDSRELLLLLLARVMYTTNLVRGVPVKRLRFAS
jgi:hypothetical protein